MDKSVGIIFFSRNPAEEAKKKLFCSGNEQLNLAIAQKLYNYTLSELRKSRLPFFRFTEQQQQGGSFGHRLANAFSRLFEMGYEKVITVGSDCLSLTANEIRNAARQLETNGIVVGPTPTGGCYLIGLRKSHFNSADFSSLPWQTPQLLTQIKHLSTSCSALDCLRDVNNEADLLAVCNKTKRSLLVQQILLLIKTAQQAAARCILTFVLPRQHIILPALGRAP